MVKKWLEVDITPDIRGRIPLLLASLSFKVSLLGSHGCMVGTGNGGIGLGILWCHLMLWFWERREFSPIIRTMFFFLQVLKHPDKKFRIGEALKATVVGPDASRAFLCLSLIGGVRWEYRQGACYTCLTEWSFGGWSPQRAYCGYLCPSLLTHTCPTWLLSPLQP